MTDPNLVKPKQQLQPLPSCLTRLGWFLIALLTTIGGTETFRLLKTDQPHLPSHKPVLHRHPVCVAVHFCALIPLKRTLISKKGSRN